MTEREAIAQATEKASRWNREYLVIHRTDHPHLGDTHYVIASAEKRLWLPTETLVKTI